MSIELNDETLTAYALGELDEPETQAVERALADAARNENDAPRKALDEIRAAIALSQEAFATGAAEEGISDEQRNAVVALADSPPSRYRFPWRAAGLAAAALLIIAVYGGVAMFEEESTQLAALPSNIETPAEKAEREFRELQTVQPGIERIFITDINNPGASASIRPDFDDPAVQQQIYELQRSLTRSSQEWADAVNSGNRFGFRTGLTAVPQPNSGPGVGTAVVPEQSQTREFVWAEPSGANEPGLTVENFTRNLDGLPRRDGNASAQAGAIVEGVEVSSAGQAGHASDDARAPDTAANPVFRTETDRLSLGGSVSLEKEKLGGERVPVLVPSAERKPAEKKPEPAPATAPVLQPERLGGGGYAGSASPAPQLTPEEMEQLQSLGYSEESVARRPAPRVALQSPSAGAGFGGSGRQQTEITAGARYSTARADNYRYIQPVPPPVITPGTESYKPIVEREFVRVADEPLSTFSIDVDTASYANVRRFLQQGQLPPPDAVRIEELINYFDYAYGQPEGADPFAAHFEMASCPWAPQHTLVRVGLKGREIPRAERPATNLVFLLDVSGSMQPSNKLPLVKWAMSQLASQLDERDQVAIVTYASGVRLALPSTNAGNQQTILNAIGALSAGGSTNGAGGIQMAYQVARQNFLPGGVNRVILATDGDFNVGLTDNAALEQMIKSEARTGVFLSVYGYGMGNLKDDRLEMLADKGNGAYGYIDSEAEARREFIEKLSGTLVTIAKDVKVQVEFNPARVAAYRLVGYENRALAAQDFNDDRKDAGEIGAGHTVTALYEVVPASVPWPAAGGGVEPLRYQQPQPSVQLESARVAPESHPAHSGELLMVKLRYKEPHGDTSKLLEFPLADAPKAIESASGDFKFAVAVAAFGKLLRGNALGESLTYDSMMQLAQAGLTNSADPHRAELISLMLQARPLLEAQGTVVWRDEYTDDLGIRVLRIRELASGGYMAQLRTSRVAWYREGQAFEDFQVLSIDPNAGCVTLFVESLQRAVTICLMPQTGGYH